jgi:autotransporter-associated beta strand protein
VKSVTLAGVLVALMSQNVQAQAAWNSALVNTADVNTTGTATTTTWSDTTAWDGGVAPNAAGLSVSMEPRHTTGGMTVTVDDTYTIGTLTSRTSNADLRFNGTGKLIFDNNGSSSFWNATSRATRITNLRADLFVDFQMNNDLEVRFGTARSEEATVGRIGSVITGAGKLTLSLAQNDPLTTRFHKIGNGATANTYSGGTEIRHVVNTAYGTGHGTGVNSLLINAVTTGAFGTGAVNLNSGSLNQTAVTALTTTTGGLQVQLTADNSMGAAAVLTQSGNGAGTVFLGTVAASTSQTIGGLQTTGTIAEADRKRVQSTAGILTINTAADQSYTYGGRITGGTTLNIGGFGTQVLNSTNTYTGNTVINGGTLQFGTQVALYNNGVAGAWTDVDRIQVASGGTLAVNVGGTGEFTTSDLDVLTALGGLASGARVGIDTSNAGGSLTYSSAIGGGIGVTKLGSGTLLLEAANLYTGPTTIKAGTLELGVVASLASTQIDIAADATLNVTNVTNFTLGTGQSLTGNGSVVGGLTVDGVLNAGNSIGTLNFGNGLNLNGTMNVELGGASLSDLYNVTGALVLGTTSILNFSNFSALTGDPGDVYVFANYTTPWNGQQFDSVSGTPSGWTVDYQYNNGTSFALVAVPEPGAVALGLLGGALLFVRRKRTA